MTTMAAGLNHLLPFPNQRLDYALGMVLARSCALTAVSACLAPWLQRKDNTLRQRLREFCYEAPAKRGKARQAVRVETCFAPLLAWVLRLWEETQLALPWMRPP